MGRIVVAADGKSRMVTAKGTDEHGKAVQKHIGIRQAVIVRLLSRRRCVFAADTGAATTTPVKSAHSVFADPTHEASADADAMA